MRLHPAEHVLLNRLCDDAEAREQVFEHICIGITRGRVNGLYVRLPLDALITQFGQLNSQLDRNCHVCGALTHSGSRHICKFDST